ncbi:MAG TPA: PilZ domain-containing protein, partial [Candidatus Acidoferrales bacterium]|nr:PilZ domain-containing protein [Candidatus Acidoferrales bacterium]
MSDSALPSNDPGTQKRRSTRIVQAVPISVTGVDALGQPFKERTTTVMVNCHGCKYQSKHYVPKNSNVTIDIPRPETSLPPRKLQGRVVWVQRPRTVRELFQIGLEFEIAGNVWGIAFPPEDWSPAPDEEVPVTPADTVATATPAANSPYASEPAIESGTPEFKVEPPAGHAAARPAAPAAPPSGPPAAAPPSAADAKIHVMPTPAPAPSADSQTLVARQLAKMVADAKDSLDKNLRKGAQSAINEEMTIVRQQLDAQLHDAVEHAIKASMERVSESAAHRVVQKAA